MRSLLTLIGVALSVVSCSSTLWDRPLAEVKAEISGGKTEFLFSLAPKSLVDADLGALGEGAAWNLGTLFAQADRTVEAELLWKRSLAGEGGPWREASGRDLFDLYSARRDWPKAEAVAEKLLGFDGGRAEFRRRLFEALYFQRKDERAWDILRSWKPGTFTPEQELENQLFFGVLSARAGKAEDASAALRDLVFDREASVLHFRLESFFAEDEGRYELLGPGGREAVAFQALVYRGVVKETQAWFKGRVLPQGFWNHRALVTGIETAFKAESHAEVGLRILEGFRTQLTGEPRFAAEYARGRLNRSLGWWSQAQTAFQSALPWALRPEDHQRTAWNWLNAWVQTRPEGALGPFLQVYSGTADPSFFTDVFDKWLTELVQARQWSLLAAVSRDLGPRLPPDDRATLGFLLARLGAHGLLDLARERIDGTAEQLLQRAIDAQPYSYEALVARTVLGQGLDWPALDASPEFRTDDRGRDRVRLWESMLGFGLSKRMASEVAASAEPLDPAFVDRAVVLLQKRDEYRPSLQLLYRLLKDPGRSLTLARARQLYPKAWETIVTDRAEAEKLEVSLLLGVIREESSFDPEARSWVGAQGLSQLMPATAAEMAKSLGMKTYDLSDPADNLKIGARYLSRMIRSQGRVFLALMAYNAGGARIKPWKEEMGRLPEEIFVEAAPFDETRGYVKKILTSTVMTGVLHYGKTVEQMVSLIYPTLTGPPAPPAAETQ